MGSGIMDLRNLFRTLIGTALALVFLVALSGYEAAASQVDTSAVQHAVFAIRIASQQPSDASKSIPGTPEGSGSMATPRPIRIDNPVACYSGCVIDGNQRRETPERPCQKRCANHCWKE